jgi:hypothetical protein
VSPNAAETLKTAGVTLSDDRVASVLKQAQGMPTRVGSAGDLPRAAKL